MSDGQLELDGMPAPFTVELVDADEFDLPTVARCPVCAETWRRLEGDSRADGLAVFAAIHGRRHGVIGPDAGDTPNGAGLPPDL